MNEEEFGQVLGHCLDRIAVGEAAATCLADYPEHATLSWRLCWPQPRR